MALVQEPDHHPHVVHFVYKLVARTRGGLREEEIVKVIHAGQPGSDGTIRKSTAAALAVGLLEREEGLVRVNQALPSGLSREALESPTAFRTLLRRLVLDPARADGPLGDRSGTCDFAQMTAWMLQLDELGCVEPEGAGFEKRVIPTFEEHLASEQEWPIRNKDQWVPFVRWFQFLGFGWHNGVGIVPDPRLALADELDAIFGGHASLTIEDFVASAGGRVPVLDGGDQAALVRRACRRDLVRRLSMATGLAIAGNEADGRLVSKKLADAAVFEGPVGAISHLEVIR